MTLASLALLGRIIVGLVFAVIGVRLLIGRAKVAMLLGVKRIPQPMVVAVAGGVFEIAAGLAVLAGLYLPAVFVAMALFVIVATLMVHDFWNKQGAARMIETNTVLTHCLVVGGLLCLAAYPW